MTNWLDLSCHLCKADLPALETRGRELMKDKKGTHFICDACAQKLKLTHERDWYDILCPKEV